MSFELAEAWVKRTFPSGKVRHHVLKSFSEAQAEGAAETIVAAPELTKNRKCYVARWTGQELVILELTALQQERFELGPGVLFHQREPCSVREELPAIRAATGCIPFLRT